MRRILEALQRARSHRVVRNAALLYLVQMTSYLFPLLILPYLSRVLSQEKFGLIGFSQMFLFYFTILTDYGFNLTATREVAVERGKPGRVNEIFGAVMVAKGLLVALGWAILWVVVAATPKLRPDAPLYFWSYLGVVGNWLFPLFLYQGLERMDQVVKRDIAAKLLALLLIFGLVRGDDQYLLAAVAQPAAALLCGLLVLGRVKGLGVSWAWPQWEAVRDQLRRGWVPFLGLVAVSGASVSNVVVLGLIATPVEVAVFSGAQRIIIALRTLVAPVSTALYPYASQKASEGEAASRAFVRRYVWMLAAPFILCGALLLVGSPLLLPWFLGEKYRESVPLLQIMAMIPALLSIVQVYSTYYMLACGYDKEWRKITLAVAVFNLTLMCLLLSGMRGAFAIAWTSLGTEALAALLYWMFYRRQSRIVLTREGVN